MEEFSIISENDKQFTDSFSRFVNGKMNMKYSILKKMF